MNTESSAISPRYMGIKDASLYLGVGERTIWARTSPRGPIPVVSIGRAKRYDRNDLDAFADASKEVAACE